MTVFESELAPVGVAQASVPLEVRQTALALGWPGRAAGLTTILGVSVFPVVSMDERAHRLRCESGQGPMLDLDVLETWEWPETSVGRAPEVIRLHGALSERRSWRYALSDVARLRGFCATAIVVGHDLTSEGQRAKCELECSFSETALVYKAHDTLRVRLPGRSGRCFGARRRTLDRWVEELIYQQIIADGVME